MQAILPYLYAFLVGGAFCLIGQVLIDRTKLTPARILSGYVVAGVLLGALGWYQPLIDFAGAGATVPLTGFGSLLARGVKEAVAEQGLLGALVGGLQKGAAGIAAAILFSVLAALIFRSKDQCGGGSWRGRRGSAAGSWTAAWPWALLGWGRGALTCRPTPPGCGGRWRGRRSRPPGAGAASAACGFRRSRNAPPPDPESCWEKRREGAGSRAEAGDERLEESWRRAGPQGRRRSRRRRGFAPPKPSAGRLALRAAGPL